ncbi:MAG: glucuronate isomerase [Pseudomonadota bacterium]
MKDFLGEDFLLGSNTAQKLYFDHAVDQPIYDYHCHLPPAEIAADRQFENLTQIWLEGDHYKWRALRTAGVDETLITGAASDKEKFMAWAATVPKTIGNPLYHWTHLELRRPFGLTSRLLGPATADAIWEEANELLQRPEFSTRGIMQQMNVVMSGTTDDPIDTLEHHKAIAGDSGFAIDVLPSFRPDKAVKIDADGFAEYISLLGQSAGIEITSFDALKQALDARLVHFAAHGCRAADNGIDILRFAPIPSSSALTKLLRRRIDGDVLTEEEVAQFSTALLVWLGTRYAELGWVMQLHIGALRNTNTRMFARLGPDSGFDSIADRPYAAALGALLNEMDRVDALPKTILYGLNPGDNEMLASMIGNFQGGMPGKIQFGSGWWYNDQKDGMERQLQQLSQIGLLSQFVGMLTDSRSFLSYTRHEYFRRILCTLIGGWVENGEAPNDMELLGAMVEDICFHNAKRYFAPSR